MIANGVKRRTTIRDVAQHTGVHPSTVSRVLSPMTRGLISTEVSDRVLRAVKELGYRANSFAYSLKTNRSFTVGVIIPDITNPLFPPIIRAIEHTLGSAGYTAMLADSNENPMTEEAILQRMMERQVDGLILATAHSGDGRAKECSEQGISTVLINRSSNDPSECSITVDDVGGMRLAVDYLVSLGHSTIAHIAGPQDTSTGHARYRGFIEAMRANSLEPDLELIEVCSAFSKEAGYDAARAILNAHSGVTAFVTATDFLALGCCDALHDRGILCPRGVSVTGFNDMPFVDRLDPPLTTIRIPLAKMGYTAANALLALMRNDAKIIQSVVLAPELIIRGSTAQVRR